MADADKQSRVRALKELCQQFWRLAELSEQDAWATGRNEGEYRPDQELDTLMELLAAFVANNERPDFARRLRLCLIENGVDVGDDPERLFQVLLSVGDALTSWVEGRWLLDSKQFKTTRFGEGTRLADEQWVYRSPPDDAREAS